jgi:hypothetical protein
MPTSDVIAILSLVVAIVSLVIPIYIHYRRGVIIRRIVDPRDRDFRKFFDLYESVIPSDERVSEDDMREYLNDYQQNRRKRAFQYDHYVFIAKEKNTVIGFISLTYHRPSRYLFINYGGRDQSRKDFNFATLISKIPFWQKLRLRSCKAIFFDLESPQTTLNEHEKKYRQKRIRRFRRMLHDNNYPGYEFPFLLLQPHFPDEEEDHSDHKPNIQPLILVMVPLKLKPKNDHLKMKKDGVISILKIVYFNWYGVVNETDVEFQEELKSFIEHYKASLPGMVNLKAFGQRG